MARRVSSGTNGRVEAEAPIQIQSETEPVAMAEMGCADDQPIDLTAIPQGLRLIGTVVERWAREFEKFIKVFYEIQGDREKYILVENHQRPLDPAKCLALGECGCWLVEIHVYQDKTGKLHYQIVRNMGQRTGSF
jgi:hypothetical protein